MIKKTNKWLLTGTSLFLALSLSFCSKEEEAKEVEYSSATIKGQVTAELDATNSELEDAPEGTQITVWISSEDLVTHASGSEYERKYYQAEVDGSGEYSVDVDVNNKEVKVHIVPNEFEYDQETSSGEERKIFSATEQTVTALPEQTKVVDFSYTP